jgi:Zn-dependent M16 (insulinase) family peptidase
MNLASVANEDRPYVVLYLNALFTLPLSFPDGTRLTHEEVINLLDKETVSYDVTFGANGAAGELLSVSIKVEVSKYSTGVSLLRDLIYHSEFVEDRLEVTIAKLQQSLPQYKRDGNGVAGAVSTDLTFDVSCTARYSTVTGMMEWVPRISKELKESPKEVVRKMKKVQAISTFFYVSLTCFVVGAYTCDSDRPVFVPVLCHRKRAGHLKAKSRMGNFQAQICIW